MSSSATSRLSRSDLLHESAGRECTEELPYEEGWVRYLGSTIVVGDEARYCRFEGPTDAAVAEPKRKAGLSFDRIAPAFTVIPKGEQR